MVNFDRMKRMAKQRLLRGGYTAVGSVASGATGNFLSERIDDERAVDIAQVAVGGAVSIGAAGFTGPGEMLDEDSFLSEAVEFAGYGIQASGWDELFEDMDLSLSASGGQEASQRVVDVSTDGGQDTERTDGRAPFRADVG